MTQKTTQKQQGHQAIMELLGDLQTAEDVNERILAVRCPQLYA